MINQDGEIYFNEFNIMMVNAYKNAGNRNNINHKVSLRALINIKSLFYIFLRFVNKYF